MDRVRGSAPYPHLGPVSRKSRDLTGHFRVSQFPLDLKNEESRRIFGPEKQFAKLRSASARELLFAQVFKTSKNKCKVSWLKTFSF